MRQGLCRSRYYGCSNAFRGRLKAKVQSCRDCILYKVKDSYLNREISLLGIAVQYEYLSVLIYGESKRQRRGEELPHFGQQLSHTPLLQKFLQILWKNNATWPPWRWEKRAWWGASGSPRFKSKSSVDRVVNRADITECMDSVKWVDCTKLVESDPSDDFDGDRSNHLKGARGRGVRRKWRPTDFPLARPSTRRSYLGPFCIRLDQTRTICLSWWLLRWMANLSCGNLQAKLSVTHFVDDKICKLGADDWSLGCSFFLVWAL